MTPTPQEIQDLRIANYMLPKEVAAKTGLSVRQVTNAEKPSSKLAAKKRREEIYNAIKVHGTGLPHCGRLIRWEVTGKEFNGVVIQSPYLSRDITNSVKVYCLEGKDNRIVHRDNITKVVR